MFSREERERYSRHFVLPEVGEDGQRALKQSRVLIVGAGGLGSPVGMYLAAAGIGTIGMVDGDVVSLSNLQRQILFSSHDVGRLKADVARERLLAINPTINVVSHSVRLDPSNAFALLDQYDIVVDCSDNFPARYLINDACVMRGKMNVFGSVFQFEGQVSVFGSGPCYRCVYPQPPRPELVKDCGESGVLGVLPGIVGALQASEVIKLILAKGTPLVGRLFMLDALTAKVQEIQLKKDPGCPVCGAKRTITSLINYEQFCFGGGNGYEPSAELEITVAELKQRLDLGEQIALLDVREPYENDICTLGGTLIPLRELEARIGELNSINEIVVYCHHGMRSRVATEILKHLGFGRVRNLTGGIDAWAREVDPTMSCY